MPDDQNIFSEKKYIHKPVDLIKLFDLSHVQNLAN